MVKSVLIVDPDLGSAEILRETLRRHGLAVRLATSGFAALDRAECEHFDLILSEMEMPAFSGLDLLQTLRTRGHITPVVLMSRERASEHDTRAMPWGQAVVAQRNRLGDLVGTILKLPAA